MNVYEEKNFIIIRKDHLRKLRSRYKGELLVNLRAIYSAITEIKSLQINFRNDQEMFNKIAEFSGVPYDLVLKGIVIFQNIGIMTLSKSEDKK